MTYSLTRAGWAASAVAELGAIQRPVSERTSAALSTMSAVRTSDLTERRFCGVVAMGILLFGEVRAGFG